VLEMFQCIFDPLDGPFRARSRRTIAQTVARVKPRLCQSPPPMSGDMIEHLTR